MFDYRAVLRRLRDRAVKSIVRNKRFWWALLAVFVSAAMGFWYVWTNYNLWVMKIGDSRDISRLWVVFFQGYRSYFIEGLLHYAADFYKADVVLIAHLVSLDPTYWLPITDGIEYVFVNFWYEGGFSIPEYIPDFTTQLDEIIYMWRLMSYNSVRRCVYNLEVPLFVYTGIFFIFSTVISLIGLSSLGLYGVFVLNLFASGINFATTAFYFRKFFVLGGHYKVVFGKWFAVFANLSVNFELHIDLVAYSFTLLTCAISFFTLAYTFSYFRYEPNVERLLLFINAFVISMVCLVNGGNFFVLFLGWELIGFTSFLLINFWSTRIPTLKAGFKAFVFNKFSDCCMLIAIVVAMLSVNDVSIIVFTNQVGGLNNHYLNILGYECSVIETLSFLFLMCAFIKSAQFGAHTWLPDSMEAPVPASALIHSATLVSAGIFLVVRLAPLFELSLFARAAIPIVGSITAFFGGICACYQTDIKRVLAYSTISHCGFLMVCCSTFFAELIILYLYVHGFFKAASFLCAGNIIRFNSNYQDFRRTGGFFKYLPFEFYCLTICLVNLMGLPATLGFYIKHILLLSLFLIKPAFDLIVALSVSGALFGVIYSSRIIYNVFFDLKKSRKHTYMVANRDVLQDDLYSNTTTGSNLAIGGLIIISYGIVGYMWHFIFEAATLGRGVNVFSLTNPLYLELGDLTHNTIKNVGYVNWLVLLPVLIVSTSSWRRRYLNRGVIDRALKLIVFFVFLFVVYKFVPYVWPYILNLN